VPNVEIAGEVVAEQLASKLARCTNPLCRHANNRPHLAAFNLAVVLVLEPDRECVSALRLCGEGLLDQPADGLWARWLVVLFADPGVDGC
jgi:hypothetical protein